MNILVTPGGIDAARGLSPGLTEPVDYLPFGSMTSVPAANARTTVLLAAIRAFAQGGYAGTSVHDILAATRLSKPTLYYHFGSKEGLFQAILDFAHDEAYARMRAAATATVACRDRLIGLTTALFEFVETNQDLTRLVFSTTFAPPRELPPQVLNLQKRRRNFEFVLGVVRAGRRSGELSGAYPAIDLTHGIYGAISHRIRMRLLLEDHPLGRREAARVVDLFLGGARRREPAS